ncbi:DUF3322 domain-containing protein [Tessaracoccus coleopterorum]|uniref:DUF3322 domain-containing protein n=1 Tax=Tessaracoccus coleopterorum TaxID=2714950 RepID=UPI0018D4C927
MAPAASRLVGRGIRRRRGPSLLAAATPDTGGGPGRPDTVAAWASAWRRLEERPGIAVEWVERRWASLGRQLLPPG